MHEAVTGAGARLNIATSWQLARQEPARGWCAGCQAWQRR